MHRPSFPPVVGRFVARATDLGFEPPRVPLRLKLARAAEHWNLYVQTIPAGPVGHLAAWVEPYGPLRIEFAPHHTLRIEFATLPAAWQAAFHDIEVDSLQLDPDGTATIAVRGPRPAVAAFAERLEQDGRVVDVRLLSRATRRVGLLTPSQDEAIRTAVDNGYYDIPRPLNLHQLAAKLGVTSASLSERLRRAEGRIIKQYRDGGPSPWDPSAAVAPPRPPEPRAPESHLPEGEKFRA